MKCRPFFAVIATVILLSVLAGCDAGNKASGKLTIVQNAEIRFMDPTLRPTTSDAHAMLNVYDTLVMRDHELNLKPGLATSWTNVNPTTWEFKLRQGVKFHNGEPFNAATLLAWFERLQTVSKRIKEYQSSIAQIDQVDRIEKVDDYTVRFITKIPDPLLPGRLSSYYTMITPAKFMADNGDKALFTKGMGTGPYKFVEWVKDDHLLLEANKDYWGGEPKVKQLQFKPVPEPSARVAALKAGEAHIADAVPPAVLKDLTADPNLAALSVPEATRIYYVSINTVSGPEALKDVRVRLAMNHAVDKKALIDKLLDGRAKPTSSMVTFQSFGYFETPPYEYDVAKAKQLMAQAGYAKGFDVKFVYTPGHYIADTEIVQAIANYLKAININVTFQTVDWATNLDMGRARKMEGLWYSGKTNLALDADYAFSELQAEKQFGWPHPLAGQTLELYKQERQEMNDAKRKELAAQIQKLYRDEAGVLSLWQQDITFGVSKKVKWTPRADGFLYGVDMEWAKN